MRPLSPDRFNALQGVDQGAGQRVVWRQAAVCPCRDPTSGAATAGCATCAGKGVTWAPGTPAWAALASMKVTREWAAFGLWESGDVVVSIPSNSPLYAAGEHDRVLMVDSSEPFSVVVPPGGVMPLLVDNTQGAVLSTDGSGPLQVELVAGTTAPLAIAAYQIDRAFWLDARLNVVEAPAVPRIAPDGSLVWPPSGAPPAGVQISVTGRKRPEYYLFQALPQDRAHFGGAALPRRVALRRFDLFGR